MNSSQNSLCRVRSSENSRDWKYAKEEAWIESAGGAWLKYGDYVTLADLLLKVLLGQRTHIVVVDKNHQVLIPGLTFQQGFQLWILP
jgi:hypothetical protein